MIAKVIVDVPSRQTDRPFDYEVPPAMQDWIEVGSRVGVPFGGRVLQGFVIGFAETAGIDAARIKPLSELLDPVPPLLPDLIELAEWISDKYCCSWIAALQAMIPAALKGKAQRLISLNPDEAEEGDGLTSLLPVELADWLAKQGQAKLETVQERFPQHAAAVKMALREGVLLEQASIRDRLAVRKVLTVFPPHDRAAAEEALAAFPVRAAKQRELLAFMLERGEPMPLAVMLAEAGGSPASVRSLVDKGLLGLREVEQQRDPYAGREFRHTEPLPLMEGQQAVYERIAASVSRGEPQALLLHGVTGSGKTEVYLQSIQHCLELGKQAIVLVPEISLTPQMVERFKGRFGDAVAVLHSRLSNGERYDEWRKIRSRRVQVAIGARSAIFAPFERIGLIIIDEEHESSYKQEESPKYHARDVAVKRARQHGAAVVLGSATPSLESFAAASRPPAPGRESGLLPMPNRVGDRPMPPVDVIDMRAELLEGNRSMFSRRLHAALAERLERGEQSVLLLNRRGYSTFVMCRSCGYTAACTHCDISLTYHQKTRALRCHYCGHAELAPKNCPSCESEHIRYFGTGTQKVEEELAKLFPGIRVIRMDVDTTTEKNAHEKLLKQFGDREADVLLGTQMVAKGLDFPFVTLVGVIAADTSLNLPDFRAAERTFQLLTQVAGRAGRHHLPGEVVVQTYTPEHYAILTAQHHDYAAFIREELKHRGVMGYPPFCRLVLVTMSHEQLAQLSSVSEQFASRLRELAAAEGVLDSLDSGSKRALEVLGPVSSPISRMKDRYRFQVVIKYRGNIDVPALLRKATAPFLEGPAQKQVLFSIDVDPQVIL
ncbi:primosomal protein N' [Paenibacillus radicis (ex Gao et al. 2016)]|uniref:Replication restart protein PriA n=1 Tax=Paenibacillus radicis (ex Gao et al. 2016) TaxID=1737354 RepID=A0A917HKK4_9BACL|nr:primosomal protein N' [Paenibacillus radicis (ex Gao et al. 2016)]GGG82673.1 primosomal protein N' [Paenibacillus radicis (ex Gao et al. 2016)]